MSGRSIQSGLRLILHLQAYEDELKKEKIVTDRLAPVLLPSYTPDDVRKRQFTAHYEGTHRYVPFLSIVLVAQRGSVNGCWRFLSKSALALSHKMT
jgi:hypothetical protein